LREDREELARVIFMGVPPVEIGDTSGSVFCKLLIFDQQVF
jgi:hypothetical protein